MNFLLLSALLASTDVTGCTQILPLPKGDVSPCDGILWTVGASKGALACRQVTVPRLEAQNIALRDTLSAETKACSLQVNALDSQALAYHMEIQDLKKPTPWYQSHLFWAPVVLVAGFSIGVSLGGF